MVLSYRIVYVKKVHTCLEDYTRYIIHVNQRKGVLKQKKKYVAFVDSNITFHEVLY